MNTASEGYTEVAVELAKANAKLHLQERVRYDNAVP